MNANKNRIGVLTDSNITAVCHCSEFFQQYRCPVSHFVTVLVSVRRRDYKAVAWEAAQRASAKSIVKARRKVPTLAVMCSSEPVISAALDAADCCLANRGSHAKSLIGREGIAEHSFTQHTTSGGRQACPQFWPLPPMLEKLSVERLHAAIRVQLAADRRAKPRSGRPGKTAHASDSNVLH